MNTHANMSIEAQKEMASELERLRKQNAAMREALYAARQVIYTYEPAPMRNVEARWKIKKALKPEAGRRYLSPEALQTIINSVRLPKGWDGLQKGEYFKIGVRAVIEAINSKSLGL